MNPIPLLSRVVFSRYFTSGLVSATGVLALGLLGYAAGGMNMAVLLGTGALTICFADNPAPIRVKAFELLFSTFGGAVCFGLVWASVGHSWAALLLVPLLGFGAGLVSLWGKRALAMSFSLLFITVITLGVPPAPSLGNLLQGVGLFVLGGLLFTAYALLLGHLLRNRTKQQALAEVLDALAAYMHWQSQFYAQQLAEDEAYGRAAVLQGAVNDALQSARDLVLREGRQPRDALWTRMLVECLDLFEAQLAAQTDSTLLRQQYEGTEVLDALQAGTLHTTETLSALALAMLHGRHLPPTPSDAARWVAVEQQAAALDRSGALGLAQAHAALASLLNTQREIDRLVTTLQATYATRDDDSAAATLPPLPDLRAFVSTWRYDPRQIRAHLRWGSPIFRHAVRLALALFCGLIVARSLFVHQTHDYWILLTIAVILRPNYGVTRQRLKDRLLGTLLGCLFTAVLLDLHLGLPAVLAALFLALTLARTFVTTNYRFTAMAASVLSLLLARLLEGDTRFLVDQRLIDTFIGATLAWGFSYVLPRWEYQDVPHQLAGLMRAQRDYAQAVLEALQHDEGAFRIARKRLFDALAAMTGLYSRMLEEPASQRRALRELARLITHSYLLAAHLASMRVLRARRAKRLSPAAVETLIAPTRTWVLQQLAPRAAPSPSPSPSTLQAELTSPPQFPTAPAAMDPVGAELGSNSSISPKAGSSAPDPLLRRLHRISVEATLLGEIDRRVARELHVPGAPGDSD